MPIASKSPEKMCRPQNSQCMSRTRWFRHMSNLCHCVFSNDFVHPTIFGSRYHILPSSSVEISHRQCHACHARQDAERGPLKGRSGLPFKGMERLFSPILPMQRKLGESETEMWLEHSETSRIEKKLGMIRYFLQVLHPAAAPFLDSLRYTLEGPHQQETLWLEKMLM